MKGIVDRFEGEYIVIELDDRTIDVPREEVDDSVQEGDVVELVDGIWVTNPSLTEERVKRIQALIDELWEDD